MHVLLHHMIPNVISSLIVMATIGMGYIILSAAGLNPGLWGAAAYSGMEFHAELRKNIHPVCPHIMIFSGLSIMLTVLVFNYLGDELRGLLDLEK